jgi:transposase
MRQVRKGRYRLLFLDEAWWGLTTQLRRVWARKGMRPVQPVWGGRRWRPVIGAVEPATGRFVSLLVGGLNSAWFSAFLAHLAAAYPGERLVVVLDNAGWHTSGTVVVPAGMTLWFQPPHSPEVNVMEQVWQWVRGQYTRGELFTTDTQLDNVLCDALDGLAHDPAQVRSLTDQPWLYASTSS